MGVLTLDEIKWQCRLEEGDTFEDTKLMELGQRAESRVAALCNMDVEEMLATYGDDLSLAPELKQAMLMIVASWYKYRENESPERGARVTNDALDIIAPYVKLC